MEHHHCASGASGASGAAVLLLANLWVMVAACDVATEVEPSASVEAQSAANVVVESEVVLAAEAKAAGPIEGGAAATIEPASFDLEAVAGVVHEGKIESAAELEVLVNDEARGYNRIDLDADGKIDHIQVVELEGPAVKVEADAEAEAELAADAVLELRAVPSSSGSVEAAVAFATVSFARHPVNSEVEIRAGFTAVVPQPEVRVYTHVVPVVIDAGVLVGGSVFLTWLYAVERPAYVGVYEVDARGHWIPPGHVKHGHWKATGDTSGRGKVRVHDQAHDRGPKKAFAGTDGRVVVDVRGSGKIQVGGTSKGGAKHHDDRGGASKAKSGSGKAKSPSGKGGKGK